MTSSRKPRPEPGESSKAKQHTVVVAQKDDAITAFFDALSAASPTNPTFAISTDITSALAAADDLPVIVLIEPPAQTLARAFLRGMAPQEALNEWKSAADVLLQACSRDRRRVLLLETGPLLSCNPESMSVLDSRLQLDTGNFKAEPVQPDPAPEFASLAGTLINSDPDAADRADMIEAMTSGPASLRDDNVTAIVKSLTELQNSRALSPKTIRSFQEERDLMLENSSRLSEEIDLLIETQKDDRGKIERLEAERDLLRDNVSAMLSEVGSLDAGHREIEAVVTSQKKQLLESTLLKARNEALERRLTNATRTADHRESVLATKLLESARKVEDQCDEADMLRQELSAILSSRSWKVTTPLRKARQWVSGND